MEKLSPQELYQSARNIERNESPALPHGEFIIGDKYVQVNGEVFTYEELNSFSERRGDGTYLTIRDTKVKKCLDELIEFKRRNQQ